MAQQGTIGSLQQTTVTVWNPSVETSVENLRFPLREFGFGR